MKGCPLRCLWCHNPEGLSPSVQLQYFKEGCIGCKLCGSRESLADAEKCPTETLKVCGKEMGIDELIVEIKKDCMFYAEDGGVTFSGGECLMQADFVAEALSRIKALGIHTVIDTSGYAKWSELEKTLQHCDLYLYDVKCITPTTHKQCTGVDNKLILDNLKRLSKEGKDIWIRVPVIPDFNDRAEEMTKIADFVTTLSFVKQVTLMPYHSLGASKYETLGMEYKYDTSKKVSESALNSFRKIFIERNIELK